MPSNYTPNYQLNQWEPDDRVLRTDFNADNLKIEAALTALSGKLGRMEIIKIQEPTAETVTGFFTRLSEISWDDWEYVCTLVYYPPKSDQTLSLWFQLEGDYDDVFPLTRFDDLSMSGHLLVLLPRHDGSQRAAGFVLSNRFIPFTCPVPFSHLRQAQISAGGTTLFPTVALFGGR